MAIHYKIVDICGNDSLKSMIHNNFGLKFMIDETTIMSEQALLEHKEIFWALIAGEAEKAEKLMRNHISAVRAKL